MHRFLAWGVILFSSLYLLFIGGGWPGIYTPGLRIGSIVLAGLALFGWLVIARQHEIWRPRSFMVPAIVVTLGSLAISTAFSRFPRQSVEYLGYAILLAALYILLVRLLANPFFRPRIGSLAVASAVILGFAYGAANIVHWVSWWALLGHFAVPPLRPESESLTFGNPSAAMTIVLLLTCSAVAVVGLGSRRHRLVVGLLMVLVVFDVFVSGSRSGWLAIAIGAAVILALLAMKPDRRRRGAALRARLVATTHARITIGVVGIGALGALVSLAPTILRRITEGGEDLRLNYLLAAQRMFEASPVVGTGPGSWVIQRIRYTIAPETDYYIPHAHNIYAQTAAELGIVGLMAGIALLASLAILVHHGMHDPDALRRRWAWAASFSIIYFAAHQLLDFYMNMPAILFAAALPIAWLDATAPDGSSIRRWALPITFPRPMGVIGIVLVAAAWTGLITTELPASSESSAIDLANAGKWAEADVYASAAVAADPAWSPYQMTIGLTAASVGAHSRAAAAFRIVAETDDLPEAWVDLAAEELNLGHIDAAKRALDSAARLGLQRTALAMAIGDLADRLEEPALALRAYAAALSRAPSLAGDPWWQLTANREAEFGYVFEAAINATSPADRWQLPLMTGDVLRARSLAQSVAHGTGAVSPEDVIDAWIGDDVALGRIVALCNANPLDGAALGWAARLEFRRGNMDLGNHYLRWAYEVSSNATEAGTETRVGRKPMLGRTAQGGQAEFWGAYTYRRFTPWNLLVPSVVQLGIE